MDSRSKKVTFVGSGGETLAARLDQPSAAVRGYALFAHCFTCTKDIFAASRIAAALAEQGIAVLRFDFTGLGHSEGEFANTNFSSNVADLLQAADFLRRDYAAPSLLIGHSLGGAAVLAAAGQVPEARGVVTIGAPADPGHVTHLFQEQRAEIEAAGEAEVLLAGRPFRIRRQFLEDIEGRRLETAIATMRKDLLIFHAPLDQTVGIENAGAIFAAAKHPKSFASLDGADHLLSRKADAIYVATLLAAWAGRHLPASDNGAEDRAADGESGVVTVRETGEGRFTQDIVVGRHRLRADEPRDVGGLDSGPGPYDLLLAGLGACTAMTLRLYADRKALPLRGVSVRLRHDKIHAADCENCETKDGRIDRIERGLVLEGDLDAVQCEKLLQIADKCPVHRSLENEVSIVTQLTTAAS